VRGSTFRQASKILIVVPAKAGTQTTVTSHSTWIPAFAGMTQFTRKGVEIFNYPKKRSKALDLAPEFDPMNFLEPQSECNVHQRLATE
jgi:hypothetical protein